MTESKYDNYRYLVVAFEEKDRTTSINRVRRSNMAKIRKTLHDLSREHAIPLADFGTNFDVVTDEEREQIQTIFKNVIERAKKLDTLRNLDNG